MGIYVDKPSTVSPSKDMTVLIKERAELLYAMYIGYTLAGFTDAQAMAIVCTEVTAGFNQ